MKIRILKNKIRLRLTQSEVNQFGEQGTVSASTTFGPNPNQVLTYSLVQSSAANTPEANFDRQSIQILIPTEMGRHWVNSEEVGIEHMYQNGTSSPLHLLIEKDFHCLKDREGEDDSDAFPNPLAATNA